MFPSFGQSLRLASAALALSLCAACTSDPEIVAKSESGGGIPPGPTTSRCRAGQYKGSFFTNQGEVLSLSGPMEFSLVLSTDKEFVEIGPNTTLTGFDPTTRAAFSAKVATRACSEGRYVTLLTDGLFTLPLADGSPFINTPFRGTIRGEYLDRGEVFFGTWETFQDDGSDPDAGTARRLLTGTWVAKWFAEVPEVMVDGGGP